jgi:hypothetical protein
LQAAPGLFYWYVFEANFIKKSPRVWLPPGTPMIIRGQIYVLKRGRYL